MIRLIKTTLILIFGLVLMGACQSAKKAHYETPQVTTPIATAPVVTGQTLCKSPRRQVCTKIYRPVCANVDTGIRCVTTPCPATTKVTKSNACTACADEKVISYVKEACN